MIAQAGDHYAHPDGDDITGDDARAMLDQGTVVFSVGIPPRSYDDEDRAQEARSGARAMRRHGWQRMTQRAHSDGTIAATIVPIVRRFVPRAGEAYVRPGWDADDPRMGR